MGTLKFGNNNNVDIKESSNERRKFHRIWPIKCLIDQIELQVGFVFVKVFYNWIEKGTDRV